MNEWDTVYAALGARTALEEALDWDTELVDYLVGAWAVLGVAETTLPNDGVVAMMLGCLPKNKQHYAKKLEKWLKIEYTDIKPG